MKYLIGQRVIISDKEIGKVVEAERKDLPNTDEDVWVFSPSRGHACRFSACNIKPLPGGQL